MHAIRSVSIFHWLLPPVLVPYTVPKFSRILLHVVGTKFRAGDFLLRVLRTKFSTVPRTERKTF